MLSGSDVPAAPLSSGGEGKALHCAPPIREPGCSGAPRLALRVNKLYPEILIPPSSLTHSVSQQYFFSYPYFCHLLFHFSLCACSFVPFVPLITTIFLFSPSSASHPSLSPVLCTQASENKLPLGLPTVLLLDENARATWRSLKVHVPNSAPSLCSFPRP